jgi:putative Mn2+ efflux pump MntP
MNFVFFFNSILLGVGLAMDAFSVSLANGFNEPKMTKNRMCLIAGTFAFFSSDYATYLLVFSSQFV